MASLTALNTASDDTLTATDLRNATLIFSYPAAFDIEMTESLGQAQIAFQYPFDVIEMIRPDLLNLEITVTVPITPAITITATGLPSGVTLSGPVSRVYTVTGIDSVDDWDDTVDALEVNIPSGYTGSFEYDVALNYFQVPDGNTSQTYTVGVARPDALLSSAFGITIPGAARLTTETNYSSQFTFAESGTYIRGPYQLQFANNFAITPTGLRVRLLNIPTVGAVAQMQTTGTWANVTSGVRNRVLPTQFSQSALGNFIADFASTMAANTTQVVETGFTRFFDATTYSALATKVTATLTSKTADFGATLSSQFGMTVTPLELPGIYETQPSVFGLDAQARFDWRSFTKTFNPAFGIAIDDTLFKNFEADLTTTATLTVNKIDNYPLEVTQDVFITAPTALTSQFSNTYDFELGTEFGRYIQMVDDTLVVSSKLGPLIYDVSDPENVTHETTLSMPQGNPSQISRISVHEKANNETILSIMGYGSGSSSKSFAWEVDMRYPANISSNATRSISTGNQTADDRNIHHDGTFWIASDGNVYNNSGTDVGDLNQSTFMGSGTKVAANLAAGPALYSFASGTLTPQTIPNGNYVFFANKDYVGVTDVNYNVTNPKAWVYTNGSSLTLEQTFDVPVGSPAGGISFDSSSWNPVCFNSNYLIMAGNLFNTTTSTTLSTYDVFKVYSMSTGNAVQTIRLDTLGYNSRDNAFHSFTINEDNTLAVGIVAGTPQDYPTSQNTGGNYDNLTATQQINGNSSYVMILKDIS